MSAKIRCPACRNLAQVELRAAAYVVACPSCGQHLRVPARAGASAPAPTPAPSRRPSPRDDDDVIEASEVPASAPAPRSRRLRDDDYPRRQRRRRADDDDVPETRPRPRLDLGDRAAQEAWGSIHAGLGCFWWKNLLLVVYALLSFVMVSVSALPDPGPVFVIVLVSVFGIAMLCLLAAFVLGIIGGIACNRLPDDLQNLRGLTSPLRTLEIVFPFLAIMSVGLLIPIGLAGPRRPAAEYGFLIWGSLAFGALGALCWLAGYVLLMLYLRRLARHADDDETAGKALAVMIAFLIAAILAPVLFYLTALAIRVFRLDMVAGYILVIGVIIVISAGWIWVLLKILQTISTMRGHIAAARTPLAA